MGPRSSDPDRPRDVICRLHHYTHKENILHSAWEAGNIDFDGAAVRILPDLSRATLQRWALLRPVLEQALQLGFTYSWGYPLSTTFRRGSCSFIFHTPGDLPTLPSWRPIRFSFLIGFNFIRGWRAARERLLHGETLDPQRSCGSLS